MQVFLASVLVYLYAVPVLLETILLLLMSSDRNLPNLSLMHLTVSNVLPSEKVLNSHLTVLGFIFTSLVPLCRVDLELLGFCNLFWNKGCEFVVSAGTSCIVVQEELLMLLMIIFPKALLGLLLTPHALTIYPSNFLKSTLPSPRQRHCHLHRLDENPQKFFCLCWVKNWLLKF